jgi:hypothetical protein
MSDYIHPDGGRRYRKGDPARRFAQLAAALAREADEFSRHYEQRMEDRDYLQQHSVWLSDPHRIAQAMASTIAAINEAYDAVNADKSLTVMDDEWRRKYGTIGNEST